MSSYVDWKAAAHALSAYLDAGLKEAPQAAMFARWRGVQVLVPEEEKPAPRASQVRETQPQARISLERDEPSTLFQVPGARDLVLAVEVRANEFTGAVPASDGLSSDTLLSRALAELLDESREPVREKMRGLGFYRVRWTSRPETTSAVPGAAQQHTDPHRIGVTYFTPDGG